MTGELEHSSSTSHNKKENNMADIELVIKIDEDEYKARQRWFANPKRTMIHPVDKAIANGTVLPEEHGRLVDADKLGLTDFEIVMCDGDYKKGLKMLCEKIENAPTILDADKESENKE